MSSPNKVEDEKALNLNRAIEALERAAYNAASLQIPISDALLVVHKTYIDEGKDHLQIEPKSPRWMRKEEF